MNTPAKPPTASPTHANPQVLNRPSRRASRLRTLHRYLGLVLLLPVLLLAVTGGLLEFTDDLKLGSRGVPYSWVHAQYNIKAPALSFTSGEVTQVGDRLFTAERQMKVPGELTGSASLELIDMVFLDKHLIILPKDTDTPPEISSLPPYEVVGVTPEMDWVLDTGEHFLFSRDLGATWGAGELISVKWLEVTSQSTTDDLRRRYGQAHLSWERWLQDLHSGRFFGPVGSWLMSLAALAFIVLALTGFIVWLRTTRRQP